MSEPATAAGRALLNRVKGAYWQLDEDRVTMTQHILAIEVEARLENSAHSEFPTATPRPWTVDTLEGGGWAVVVDADGAGAKVIAELDDTYGDRAANAALIVEAVNALAALEVTS